MIAKYGKQEIKGIGFIALRVNFITGSGVGTRLCECEVLGFIKSADVLINDLIFFQRIKNLDDFNF
jgi:hypothetical protein